MFPGPVDWHLSSEGAPRTRSSQEAVATRAVQLPGSRVAGRAPPSRVGAGGRCAGPVGCLCGAPPAAGPPLLWPGGLPPTQARDAGAGTGLQGLSGRCRCVSVFCAFGLIYFWKSSSILKRKSTHYWKPFLLIRYILTYDLI